MARALILIIFVYYISTSAKSQAQSDSHGFISAVISEKGLVFVKDILIEQALATLTPLHLPEIQKSIKIPFIGRVHVSLSNFTLSQINVSTSYIKPGETGIVIMASGATANLSTNWRYSYSTWLIPIKITDRGRALIQVEGIEIGITVRMKNQEGSLKLNTVECGCYMKDMSIILDGGASWFYQGFVDAFGGQIKSAVENAISKKIREGIVKLDGLLQDLPKEIRVDDIASLNVTFVEDPVLKNSSVGFEINGLFTATDQVSTLNHRLSDSKYASLCDDPTKMILISLEEPVFKSASDTYFQAGIMQWTITKVPEQSLLNTAGWKYIVPQLYKKYPNDDMQLNISVTSPPTILLSRDNIDAIVSLDMIIEVLDVNDIVPVACISMDVSASGLVQVTANNLAGEAELDSFTLNLKWSKVGNFHMHLVEVVIRVFLRDVALPFVNSRLRKGFPLPIIQGFTLKDASIICADSKIVVCSDVTFSNSLIFNQLQRS